MTDRERLIELMVRTFEAQDKMRGFLTAEHTADYLLANGVTAPPLKVGDTIYRLDTTFNNVVDWTVVRIDIYEEERVYCDDCYNTFTDEEIGEGVFLTKELAEKALAERIGK
jgi:hypothetical protein